MRTSQKWVLLAGLFVLLLPACKKSLGDACKHDSACGTEHVCYHGRCDTQARVLEEAMTSCRTSHECEEYGSCTPKLVGYQTLVDEERWKCMAASDADCRPSRSCKQYEQCRAVNGSCKK